MNSLKSLSFLLIVATLACTCWRTARCSTAISSEELEEIEVFLRSVLVVAQPYDLGIPDRLPAQKNAPMTTVDGRLPDDLQRYLESLLAVSSAVDRRTLVAMLLDDKLMVDEDLGPHRVFDLLHDGRKSETRTESSTRTPKTFAAVAQQTEHSGVDTYRTLSTNNLSSNSIATDVRRSTADETASNFFRYSCNVESRR